MASKASPEASEVRRRGQRRLIGAVAIVLLLVVFVPMLLDSEPRPASKGPELQIPPRENAPPLPAPPAAAPPAATVAPSPKMAAATPNPAKESRPAPKAEVPRAEADKPAIDPAKVVPEAAKAAAEAQLAVVEPQAAAKKAEVLKTPAKADPAPAKAAAAPPKLEGFAIQVGAFRDEEKLRQAREKLAAAGVVHYTERIESPSGPMTRLRAGPFPTRPAAEATASKLKGVAPDAKVVPLP